MMPLFYMDGNIHASSNNSAVKNSSHCCSSNNGQIDCKRNSLLPAISCKPCQAGLNATQELFTLNPSPIHNSKLASCDNICTNFRTTRNQTLDRTQCAHNSKSNRILQFRTFKSTADLTSTNANTESPSAEMNCCRAASRSASIAFNHPDVIILNNYQPPPSACLTLLNSNLQCHNP